jgi:hypothetical protein
MASVRWSGGWVLEDAHPFAAMRRDAARSGGA